MIALETSIVKVETLTYQSFFEQYDKLRVPEYQRPYRWTAEKVAELLADLEEFFIHKPQIGLDYYMGTILLYQNSEKEVLEIIDGQQRLTTLILLEYILEGRLRDNQHFRYNHHISFSNIQKIKRYLQGKKGLLEKLAAQDFLNKLKLTVIISESEDHAFTFFDSQNNRGVGLGADDYLKAYHLRAVPSETLQATLAQQWEGVVFQSQREQNQEAGLLHLFYKILYRSREWKGQSSLIPEHKDEILKSFQKRTRQAKKANEYPLFSSRNNLKYNKIQVNEDDSSVLVSIETGKVDVSKLPFTLRQPLYKGHNFFQFTQKYYAIHRLLFSNESTDEEAINKVRAYYQAIYTPNMSIYLRHFMQMCLVMYYDVFGTEQLEKAIQYFDYFIGSIRIEKYYVRKEAIKNSLMERSNNLLDVIAQAYLPEEIFEFITSQAHLKWVYDEEAVKDDGVKGQYKKRVINYFEPSANTLKNRLEWIK